ncbi:MAG: hypothetical protein GF405_06540 [Candidatus Eisenbacteria bacterium]|nr:hypothetical protein [Candidatus Eisenbacteria bacterium]
MAPPPRSVERHVMPSGLIVLTELIPESPVASVVLSVLAGTRREPAGRDGLATLAADALLEGTRERPGPELAWAIDSLGGSVDVLTGYEACRIVATGLGDTVHELAGLVAEMAFRPTLEPAAVERSKRRLLREIEEEDDDRYVVAQRALFRLVFGDHPRGRAGIGTADGVGGATVEDVRRFHARGYRLDRALLAVAGRFDRDAVFAAAGDLERRTAPSEDPPVPAPPPVPPESRLIRRESEQVHLAVGARGIRRTDPLYLPACVLDVIFGDSAGFASRLAARLREGDGLAYMVEGDLVGSAGVDPGLVSVYTATAPDRVRAALEAVGGELRRAVGVPPSDEELDAARAFLKGRRILERETTEARAASLIRIERYRLGFDYDERYPGLLDDVTGDSVLEAAHRLLDPSGCSVVVVGPLDEPLPLLAR